MSVRPMPRPSPGRRTRRRRVAIAAIVTSFLAGCALPQFTTDLAPPPTVTVSVFDEHGDPVGGARVTYGDRTATTDMDGRTEIESERAVVAIISGPGFLDEPVAIAADDQEIDVRLWRRTDADGVARTSVHFGGDVMLGRRYLDEDRPTPHVSDAASARRVVAELGPMAAAADTTVVNLETVIGELPDDLALPGKRYIIQSSPLVTEALDELGVDLVTLGNNHTYDFGDIGLASTLAVLDAAGLEHVGAAVDPDDAVRGHLLDTGPITLGVISASTMSGDLSNDRLPDPEVPTPADLEPDEAWRFERRAFGLRSATESDDDIASLQVPLRDIRIKEAWDIVESAEAHLPPDDAQAAWELASAAFPELQDWVARRGHGGPAHYRADAVHDEIGRLQAAGADFVVVQLHGGTQYAPVPSEFVRRASRAAIDAGADAVVSHHPHVLQGVEWYQGRLIAYSLGNLVFDQNLLSTFPSALLRVVTDGDRIVDARLLPFVLDRYRPTPLSGTAARNVVRTVATRSLLGATGRRHDGEVRTTLDEHVDASDPAAVTFERSSGVIAPGTMADETFSGSLGEDGTTFLPDCSLVRADTLRDDVEIATELFWWGTFDRDTTDANRDFPTGWLVPSSHDRWDIVDGAHDDPGDLAIELTSAPDINTTVRIAALIDLPEHRLFDAAGDPVDTEPSYEVRLWARRNRGSTPFVRLAAYVRNHPDPPSGSSTVRIAEVELPIDVPVDDEWHRVTIPVPEGFVPHDLPGDAALNVTVATPPGHLGMLAIDDVEVLEWRGRVRSEQPVWASADLARSFAGTDAVDLDLRRC